MEDEIRESLEEGKTLLCRECYAEVAVSSSLAACPACGCALAIRVSNDSGDSTDLRPRAVDHRGILLPRRHAVGGVITPR